MPPFVTQVIISIFYAAIGAVMARYVPHIVGRMVVSNTSDRTATTLSNRRADTLRGLSTHLARAIIIGVTAVLIFARFVDSGGLLTFLGLFSAAFGLGARPLVSDYISGVVFLFEDQYNVGEKVEVFGIEGTVLSVNLRTTILRSQSGELYTIPNGEVRVVRNFGRGEFSLASIRFTVPNRQLEKAMRTLNQLSPNLPRSIPELVEPPRILSEDGTVSDKVALTLFAKARYGQGMEARNKLLPFVVDALNEADVDINTIAQQS